ncbi:MAG: hypothetical protein GX892_12975 [Thermoanaerobacteraceae bacterium]|nr:hypothetical protein [Thermoanaerobacteraceae bacterium]
MLSLAIRCYSRCYGMFIYKDYILLEGYITHSEELFLKEFFSVLSRSIANNALSVSDFSILLFEGYSLSCLATLRGLGLALGLKPIIRAAKGKHAVNVDGHSSDIYHWWGGYCDA